MVFYACVEFLRFTTVGTNVDTNADTDVQIKLILKHYKTEND